MSSEEMATLCHVKWKQVAAFNMRDNGFGGMSGEMLFERMGAHPGIIMKTILDVGANDGTLRVRTVCMLAHTPGDGPGGARVAETDDS